MRCRQSYTVRLNEGGDHRYPIKHPHAWTDLTVTIEDDGEDEHIGTSFSFENSSGNEGRIPALRAMDMVTKAMKDPNCPEKEKNMKFIESLVRIEVLAAMKATKEDYP